MYACSEERFLGDVKTHEMKVIRDDGVHRHLQFRMANSSIYWFDILTWDGSLCVTGDCGTYVFRRVTDMFKFFRQDRDYVWPKGNNFLSINPCYWAEKAVAKDKDGEIERFCNDKFEDAIKHSFECYFESYDDHTKKDEIWEAIESELFGCCTSEYEASEAISSFTYSDHPIFQDFWEYNLKAFTFSLIWNLYAIVWGIRQYDVLKGGE